MNEDTLKVGLLMESAQAHQKQIEDNLERLKAHTRDLDQVVRDEIRRTLVGELQAVTVECGRAAEALRGISRAAGLRGLLWIAAMAVTCTAIPGAVVAWALPSPAQIAALRAQRDELTAAVLRLEHRGGHVDWRLCGAAGRLCVRIERRAPAYGESGDYLILKGY